MTRKPKTSKLPYEERKKLWCSYCGSFGNHTSGSCELIASHKEQKALTQVIVDLKLLLNQSQEREARLVELLKRAIDIAWIQDGYNRLLALCILEKELKEDKV